MSCMIAAADIERMSVGERLQAIELLWSSISRSGQSPESPMWHGEVLASRRAKIESGEAEFLSIAQVRTRLHQSK